MNRLSPRALNHYARLAGFFYLLVIIGATFSQGYVRSTLIVSDDAAATAHNIMASEGLFRLGLVGDLIAFISDIVLSILFFLIFKNVSKPLAMIASAFRLVMAAVLGVNLINHFIPLLLLSGDAYLSSFSPDQLYTLAAVFLKAHTAGYLIGLFFFGGHCLVLGYLLFKSSYVPRVFAVFLIIAAFGYFALSLSSLGLGSLNPKLAILFMIPAPIAEWSLCLWLLIKGMRAPQIQDANV